MQNKTLWNLTKIGRSPERKEAALSPGGRSISDIFGKVTFFKFWPAFQISMVISCQHVDFLFFFKITLKISTPKDIAGERNIF